MAYSNPYRYNNRTSIDGAPLKKGYVLVPVGLQDGYRIPKGSRKNLTTYHMGEFRFLIGFIPQPVECFEDYMVDFWKEIRTYIDEHCTGRCVTGYRKTGEPICCPKTKCCKDCTEKYDHEHYNPRKDRYQVLSLDYCYENEDFDYVDENAVDSEEYIISQEEEDYEAVKKRALAYLEKQNARHAQIIRLELEGKNIEEICIAIKLKSSRGREVINEANDALCDYLKAPHMKTKHRR